MAENKKGFLLYADNQTLINKLPDELAGKLFKHIFAFVNDENPQTNDLLLDIAFEPIKQQLKRDLVKYEAQLEQRKEAGKRSAEVRKHNATTVNDRSISSTDNVSVTDNDTVTDTDNDILLKKETKDIPAFSDFLIYAKEKEPSICESGLKNKYDSWVENNWKDGHNSKITNWKTKLLNTIPYLPKKQLFIPDGYYLAKDGKIKRKVS